MAHHVFNFQTSYTYTHTHINAYKYTMLLTFKLSLFRTQLRCDILAREKRYAKCCHFIHYNFNVRGLLRTTTG